MFLGLSDNVLESFESRTFDCLPRLTELHINANYFESLQPGLFKELKKLEVLSLEGNPLEANLLPFDTFMGLENVLKLSLSPLAQSVDQNALVCTKHLKEHVIIEFVYDTQEIDQVAIV